MSDQINETRRKFFTLRLSTPLDKMDNQDDEMIKMLTQDGHLVQVPKSVIENHSSKTVATKLDIINWSNKLK